MIEIKPKQPSQETIAINEVNTKYESHLVEKTNEQKILELSNEGWDIIKEINGKLLMRRKIVSFIH